MRTRLTLYLLLLALPSSSCHLLGKPRPVEIVRTATTTPSGVVWRDLLLGTGNPAKVGDHLLVDYVARLADGTLVFSTSDTGLPANFSLGAAPVRGWNEALIGMRQGGKRSVNHAHHSESTNEVRQIVGSVGANRITNPQDTVAAHLEQHAG